MTSRFVRLILSAVMLVACVPDALVPDYAPPIGNLGLIGLMVPPAGTADGAEVLTLVAQVDTQFRSLNGTVNFSTTSGTFTNGNAVVAGAVDSAGFARAFLRAPRDSATAYVTASVAGTSKTRTIAFGTAQPTSISVVATKILFTDPKAGDESAITATLFRARGTPSVGGEIRFELGAITGSVKPELSVKAVPADSKADTKLTFLSADPGTVWVRALYARPAGADAILKDSVLIRVQKS